MSVQWCSTAAIKHFFDDSFCRYMKYGIQIAYGKFIKYILFRVNKLKEMPISIILLICLEYDIREVLDLGMDLI
jgi:hypothetical protein